MPAFTPTELAERLGSGLLSFPVTHFTRDLAFDESAYRENIIRLGKYEIAGLFAAGGTGEFFVPDPGGSRHRGPSGRRQRARGHPDPRPGWTRHRAGGRDGPRR